MGLLFRLVRGLLTLPVLILSPVAQLLFGGSWAAVLLKALVLYVAAAVGLNRFLVEAEERSKAEQTRVQLLNKGVAGIDTRRIDYGSTSERKTAQLVEMKRRAVEKEQAMKAYERQLKEEERQARGMAGERRLISPAPAPRTTRPPSQRRTRDSERDSTFSSAKSVNDDFINRSPDGSLRGGSPRGSPPHSVKELRRNAASERTSQESEEYDSEEDRESVAKSEDGFATKTWKTITLQN